MSATNEGLAPLAGGLCTTEPQQLNPVGIYRPLESAFALRLKDVLNGACFTINAALGIENQWGYPAGIAANDTYGVTLVQRRQVRKVLDEGTISPETYAALVPGIEAELAGDASVLEVPIRKLRWCGSVGARKVIALFAASDARQELVKQGRATRDALDRSGGQGIPTVKPNHLTLFKYASGNKILTKSERSSVLESMALHLRAARLGAVLLSSRLVIGYGYNRPYRQLASRA